MEYKQSCPLSKTQKTQIQKLYSSVYDLFYSPEYRTKLITDISNNEYDPSFFNDNNEDPLKTIVGISHDLLNGRKPSIKAVKELDLTRYMGMWYNRANYTTSFQGPEIVKSTAEYKLLSDGKVEVVNKGYYADDKFTQVTGYANRSHFTNNGKLDVTFVYPFSGKYWVIDLGDDYEYSVVSNPTGEYLWILTRTTDYDITPIVEKLKTRGYDVSKLFYNKW